MKNKIKLKISQTNQTHSYNNEKTNLTAYPQYAHPNSEQGQQSFVQHTTKIVTSAGTLKPTKLLAAQRMFQQMD